MLECSPDLGRNMFYNLIIFDAKGPRISALLLPFVGRPSLRRSRRLGFRLDQRSQRLPERLASLREQDAVLRGLRSGRAGFDAGEIETQKLGVFSFGRFCIVEESLLARIGFHQCDLLLAAAREFE